MITYLATLAKVGGPLLALMGALVWYQDRRASEEHDGEQAQINRLAGRVEKLEGKVGKQRDKLDEYSRELSQVRRELSQAEIEKGQKDAEIERLQARVDTLQQKVCRLEADSEPSIGNAPTDPQESS